MYLCKIKKKKRKSITTKNVKKKTKKIKECIYPTIIIMEKPQIRMYPTITIEERMYPTNNIIMYPQRIR